MIHYKIIADRSSPTSPPEASSGDSTASAGSPTIEHLYALAIKEYTIEFNQLIVEKDALLQNAFIPSSENILYELQKCDDLLDKNNALEIKLKEFLELTTLDEEVVDFSMDSDDLKAESHSYTKDILASTKTLVPITKHLTEYKLYLVVRSVEFISTKEKFDFWHTEFMCLWGLRHVDRAYYEPTTIDAPFSTDFLRYPDYYRVHSDLRISFHQLSFCEKDKFTKLPQRFYLDLGINDTGHVTSVSTTHVFFKKYQQQSKNWVNSAVHFLEKNPSSNILEDQQFIDQLLSDFDDFFPFLLDYNNPASEALKNEILPLYNSLKKYELGLSHQKIHHITDEESLSEFESELGQIEEDDTPPYVREYIDETQIKIDTLRELHKEQCDLAEFQFKRTPAKLTRLRTSMNFSDERDEEDERTVLPDTNSIVKVKIWKYLAESICEASFKLESMSNINTAMSMILSALKNYTTLERLNKSGGTEFTQQFSECFKTANKLNAIKMYLFYRITDLVSTKEEFDYCYSKYEGVWGDPSAKTPLTEKMARIKLEMDTKYDKLNCISTRDPILFQYQFKPNYTQRDFTQEDFCCVIRG